MKGKVKHIVGIVLSTILLPISAYGALVFYLVFALSYDLNGGFKGEGIGTAFALTLILAVVTILCVVFLVLCSVCLAKINKKEKALRLEEANLVEIPADEAQPQ